MLNKNSNEITQAGSIFINEKVDVFKKQGRDIIVLLFREAFNIPEIDLNPYLRKGAHYSDSQGLLELKH